MLETLVMRFVIPSPISHQEIDPFDDIQEDFILTILDAFRAPRHSIGNGNWRPRGNLKLMTLLSNISVGRASTSELLKIFTIDIYGLIFNESKCSSK